MANQPQTKQGHFTYPYFGEFFDPPDLPRFGFEKKRKNPRKSRRKSRPQPGTIQAIHRLCQIRLDAIKAGHALPVKATAAVEAGTSFKTVQQYMPELFARWHDKTYRPEKLE